MRNRIIMAAVEEINLRGFKFTMSDLTRRLHISKTSLYEYFPSKNELITVIVDSVLNDFTEQEEKIYNSKLTIIEKFKGALTISPQTFEPFHNRVYDDLRLTYPGEWQKVADCRKKRMDRLTTLLLHGMEGGSIRSVNIAVIQQMLISTLNDLVNYNFLVENNLTYSDAVTALLDVVINGLSTQTK